MPQPGRPPSAPDETTLQETANRPPWSRPVDRDRAYITNPHVIRILAHPGRMTIMYRLQSDGPATATECARVAGMSPSAASYHLHQLARYGFVKRAENRGDLRERLWQANALGYRIDEAEHPDQATIDAERQLMQAMADSSETLVRQWLEHFADEPHIWRSASMIATKGIRVNAEELGALYERIAELLQPYLSNRRTRAEAPLDARLVHVDLRLFPLDNSTPVTLTVETDRPTD